MSALSLTAEPPILRASGAHFQKQMNGLLKTRFELTSSARRSFDGEIAQSFVSERLRLADIRFTPHYTRLLPGKGRNPAHNAFLISWQIEGTSLVRQGAREAQIGAGELFFIDTSAPFAIETDNIRTRSIYLDSQLWRDVFPERHLYTATPIHGDRGMGRLCTDLVSQLFAAAATHPAGLVSRMALSLAHLVAVTMLKERPAPADAMLDRQGHIGRIRSFVLDNLSDPQLDVTLISRHIGLSKRHIHQLYAANDMSLMRWIWSERLHRVARDLANPALKFKSVSAIAFEWGFSEAAHFSRSFKAQFGKSPTDWRSEALVDLGHKI
ncbi:MAG: helix-turn-helix domain-containing protein [Rhizobiales bacterium]|nr:helix-turn-helix domain-containing protein [Hyphomicrobiales bacterium]